MFRSVLTCPAYHHIGETAPSVAARLGVWTSTADFVAHLDHFEKNYDIVDLDTILHRAWPKRPLLLSFDDSYRSLADTVAPLMKRRGLPGIVFLNPDMIERPVMLFDHVLSELAERFGLARLLEAMGPAAVANGSVQACLNAPETELAPAGRRALQDRLLSAFGLDEAKLHADSNVYLRPSDFAAFAAAGLEVGNHTASHARCRTLDGDALVSELSGARNRLEVLSGQKVRAFSVPYGSRRDATPSVVAELKASGHEAIFLSDGRISARGGSSPHVWDRVAMDGVTAAKVRLHLGLRPRLRGIKDMARGWTSLLATPAYIPDAVATRSTALFS